MFGVVRTHQKQLYVEEEDLLGKRWGRGGGLTKL